MCRDAEEDEGEDAEVERRPHFLDEAVDTELIVARHRRNFFLDAAARTHEKRKNQVRDTQRRFAHQFAHQGVMPQPSRPLRRVAGGSLAHVSVSELRTWASLVKHIRSGPRRKLFYGVFAIAIPLGVW